MIEEKIETLYSLLVNRNPSQVSPDLEVVFVFPSELEVLI